MRVDYYHTGNDKEERFSLDRIVIEPLPWPGNPAKPIDDTNRGKYFFEVVDTASGRMLYSRGFASIYGEWETTAEAKSMNRTFSESLRFPAVDRPARIVVKKRDPKNAFQEIWTLRDRSGRQVHRAGRADARGGLDHQDSRSRRSRGEAGSARARRRLHRCRARQVRTRRQASGRRALQVSPFKERQKDINVWGLVPAAVQSGISRPSQGIHRRSPLGTTYDAFGSERYVLTFENRAFRDIASNAPYDVVEILTNSATYGGGGIYGLYSTVAADSAWAPYVFIHEFGHHLAGLADEYYTSDVAYLPAADRQEPWEPNVTALLDPSTLKWRDLVAPGTPLPTPWPKEEFETHSKDIQERRRQIRAVEQTRGRDGRAVPRADGAGCGAPRSRRTRAERSAHSRERTTRRAVISGRRPTASCSHATRCRSAWCVSAPSDRFSISTPANSACVQDVRPRRRC